MKSVLNEATRIRRALERRRCVSAWLGHGDALFLGIDDEGLRVPLQDEPQPRAPIELETNYAAWSVEGPVSATWTDNESEADSAQLIAAAESLVGERAIGWELLERLALRVEFSGNKVLTVQPWPVSDGVSDAWSLRSTDKHILAVSNDGRMVVVDETLPIHDWFSDCSLDTLPPPVRRPLAAARYSTGYSPADAQPFRDAPCRTCAL